MNQQRKDRYYYGIHSHILPEVPCKLESKLLKGGYVGGISSTIGVIKLHRFSIATTSFNKLQHLWRSSLSRKIKVHIFLANIVSSLIQGLPTLIFEDKHYHKVDSGISDTYAELSEANPRTTPILPTNQFGTKQHAPLTLAIDTLAAIQTTPQFTPSGHVGATTPCCFWPSPQR